MALFAALAPVQAESWTNQAGRVIEARLGSFDGVSVTLIRTNGSSLRLPLSALSNADQRRVRLQKAQSIAPDFVRSADHDARAVLERFERLPDDQRTAEGRKKAVHMACSIFDARVKARSAEVSDKEVLDEIKRLRALLADYAP
jgi:hypothetical protein